jgi:hypothetical protein
MKGFIASKYRNLEYSDISPNCQRHLKLRQNQSIKSRDLVEYIISGEDSSTGLFMLFKTRARTSSSFQVIQPERKDIRCCLMSRGMDLTICVFFTVHSPPCLSLTHPPGWFADLLILNTPLADPASLPYSSTSSPAQATPTSPAIQWPRSQGRTNRYF